jgi:hypothetical protein
MGKAELGIKVVDDIPPIQPDDVESMIPVKEEEVGEVEAKGRNLNKPSCYYEGTKLVIRASAFGSCIGSLVRAAMGQTPDAPPKFMQEKFDQGHDNEPIILRKLTESGLTLEDDWTLEDRYGALVDGQVEIDLPIGDNIIIRQHFDGFGHDADGWNCFVEAKAFAPSTMEAYKRAGIYYLPQYPWQVAIAMASTGLPCLYAVGEKDDEGVVQDVGVHIIDEAPYDLADIKARAFRIYGYVTQDTVPPCDFSMFPCGYWKDHDKTQGVWAEKVPHTAEEAGVDGRALIEAAAEYQAADTMLKQWEPRKKAAKAALDALLEGKLDLIVTHEGITVKPMATKPKKAKVDWQAAAKAKGVTDDEAEAYRGEDYMGNWYKVEMETGDK